VKRSRSIVISVTVEEYERVENAAASRWQTVIEYVRAAINASLRREGVDAVFLAEREPAKTRRP